MITGIRCNRIGIVAAATCRCYASRANTSVRSCRSSDGINTGGHFHQGWANNDQRKLVLNAILWTAKAKIPVDGVASTITEEDMKANLDLKPGQGLPEKPKAAKKVK